MLILELGEVVHIFINNDVEVVGLVVGCHVGSGECLRHLGRGICWSSQLSANAYEYRMEEDADGGSGRFKAGEAGDLKGG